MVILHSIQLFSASLSSPAFSAKKKEDVVRKPPPGIVCNNNEKPVCGISEDLMRTQTVWIHSGFPQTLNQWQSKRRPCCYLRPWTLAQRSQAQLSWTRFSCLRTRSHMHALEFYLQIPEHHSYVPRARPPATIKNASAACWLSRALINTALYYKEKLFCK